MAFVRAIAERCLERERKSQPFPFNPLLVVSTKTQAKFRFRLPHNSGDGEPARLLDRFQWIPPEAVDRVETKHLEKMNRYVDAVIEIYTARKRLRNSLVLTYNGCTTIFWQVAFVCWCAAAEGILTYSKDPGITKRLAKSFACLTGSTKRGRDSTYRAFKHLYEIRSDIMHGRATDQQVPRRNLAKLSKLSNLIRMLWKTVLSSTAILTELEKSDADRKAFFSAKESGYTPPNNSFVRLYGVAAD